MTNKKFINSITTATAIEIHYLFDLDKTQYRSTFRQGVPVNEQVLRKFVRRFLREKKITQAGIEQAKKYKAAGMPLNTVVC